MNTKQQKSLLIGLGIMILGFGMWMQNLWAAVFMVGIANVIGDAVIKIFGAEIEKK
jgi:protein-S-isoprenylcysteine O-methyltransferase Ste14